MEVGLIAAKEGIGAKALLDMKVDFDRAREEVIRIMNESETQS